MYFVNNIMGYDMTARIIATLGNAQTSTHLYELGVMIDDSIVTIEVYATNRARARRIAEKANYNVCDVNMVG